MLRQRALGKWSTVAMPGPLWSRRRAVGGVAENTELWSANAFASPDRQLRQGQVCDVKVGSRSAILGTGEGTVSIFWLR